MRDRGRFDMKSGIFTDDNPIAPGWMAQALSDGCGSRILESVAFLDICCGHDHP